jgi:hypothetical protein
MWSLHLVDNKGVVGDERVSRYAFPTLAFLLLNRRNLSSEFLKGTPVPWQGN